MTKNMHCPSTSSFYEYIYTDTLIYKSLLADHFFLVIYRRKRDESGSFETIPRVLSRPLGWDNLVRLHPGRGLESCLCPQSHGQTNSRWDSPELAIPGRLSKCLETPLAPLVAHVLCARCLIKKDKKERHVHAVVWRKAGWWGGRVERGGEDGGGFVGRKRSKM